MDESSRSGWRKKGRSPGRRRASASDQLSGWQSRRVDDAQTAVFRHRMRLLGLGLLTIGLVALFVCIAFWWRKKTPIISLTVTQYTAPIPPNSYAREDAERLTTVNKKNLKFLPDEFHGEVRANACVDFLMERLASQAPGGPGKDVAIVYLSAHGVVDGQDRPCFLLSDADPLDSSTWMPVADVLAGLKEQQSQWQDASRKIVLLLDSGRVDDNWRLGILYNAFADALPQTIKEAGVPGLYVLNSTSSGQVAWPAPKLDGTAFGYFLAEGLSGEAKGRDNKITLRELFDYVVETVGRWAINNRADIQQPMLIPELSEEEDFAIAFAGGRSSLQVSDEQVAARRSSLTESQQELGRLWQQYDRVLHERSPVRTDPVGLAELQNKLLRAEQLVMAGKDYRNELAELRQQITNLLSEVGHTRLPESLRAYSIPLSARLHEIPEPADDRSVRLQAWKAAGGRPKPKEGDPEPPPLSYLASAEIGWNWLAEHPRPGRDQLREVLELVSASNGPRSSTDAASQEGIPDVAEVHFLKLLDRHLDWNAPAAEAHGQMNAAIGKAIVARRRAEMASAPEDERVHYCVQPLVEEADQKRRIAEDLLFVGSHAALGQADATWTELTGQDGATGLYGGANRHAGEVAECFALRDRAWAELPYLARWVVRQLREGRPVGIRKKPSLLVKDVFELIRSTHDLGDELDESLIGLNKELPAGLVEAADVVRGLHGDLKDAYVDGYCGYLDEDAGPDKETLRRIGQALRTPLLNADLRSRLTDKYLRILFLEGGFDEDDEESRHVGMDEVTEASKADKARAAKHVQQLGQWDRHLALEILDRSRLVRLKKEYEHGGRSRKSDETDQAWLAHQGEEVRTLLRDVRKASEDWDAPAEKTAAKTRAGFSQADRLTRAVVPLLKTEIWKRPKEMDPVHRLRLVDHHFLMLWHGHRVLEDFWDSVADTDSEPYFAATVSEYVKSTQSLAKELRGLRSGQEDLADLLERGKQAAREIEVDAQDVLLFGKAADAPTVSHHVAVEWHRDAPRGIAAVYLQDAAEATPSHRLIPVWDEADERTVRRRGERTDGESSEPSMRYQIDLEELDWAAGRAELDATAFFRGHVGRGRFIVRRPSYVTEIEVEPRSDAAAKITVRGEGDRPGHIMFVFDCSGSMGNPGTSGSPRIGMAQAAMESILMTLDEQVQAKARYWIGLRAYGRRSKYVKTESRTWKDYKLNSDAVQDVDVAPDIDVEGLFPLREFEHKEMAGNAYLRELRNKLRELVPWGQTPLYYALRVSLDDFTIAKPNEPKHIVVITDGINKVSGFADDLPHVVDRQNAMTSKGDVIAKWRQKQQRGEAPPRIHIIGLDMAVDAAERREFQELKKLAPATGGKYYDAADTDSLTKALRDALRLAEFSISGPGDEEAGVEKMDLGQWWPVRVAESGRSRYEVTLHGNDDVPPAHVELEGGESVVLEYSKRRNRLIYPRYEPQEWDRSDDKRGPVYRIENPMDSAVFAVQSLLPRRDRDRNNVNFYVYVQDEDELKFTPRPKDVCAEIRPVGSSSQRMYYYFDLEFVDDRPVPVFSFEARGWPKDARADIKLWFHPTDIVEPDRKEKVERGRASQFELNGVSFAITNEPIEPAGYRITVTERHPIDSEFAPARVQISPRPKKTFTHRFSGGVNVVQHGFDFDELTPATVEVTARDTLRSHSLAVPPFQVAVPR